MSPAPCRPAARAFVALAAVGLAACPQKRPVPPPQPSGRCEVDLAKTGLFSAVGSGARALRIESPQDLIGGPSAQGEVGDFLLANDKVRVVIQKPGRVLAPFPFGGAIIDADRRRPAGEPGRDQLGKIGLLYAFGRAIDVTQVEVLDDGENGGPAVIAATGQDALNDALNVPLALASTLGPGARLAIDPDQPLSLRATTYFVLSPGESRVRMLTALCNEGRADVRMPVGDFVEQGGATDFFNPQSCTGATGADGCLIDASPWFGYQGDAVAYALRPYRFSDLSQPETANALLAVHGSVGLIAGGESQAELLAWFDEAAPQRAGTFTVPAGEQRSYLRDLVIGRDLAEVTSAWTTEDEGPRARVYLEVTRADGTPAAGARVAVVSSNTGQQTTLGVADADGNARIDLRSGAYRFSAALPGHAVDPPKEIHVPSSGSTEVALTVGRAHTLTIRVEDPFGAPLPAKVTVLCPNGPCPTSSSAYASFWNVEALPSNVAAIGLVPPQGTLALPLPPGDYEVVVTRGPEYSAWPDTWPIQGARVDLTAADQQLEAVLARVVDSAGWMSADLHVHAVASADSSVPQELRVLGALAEGLDVIASGDHDAVTDYAPAIASLGASEHLAALIGEEVSPFDFGHFQAFPIAVGDGPNGGAFDWTGGNGPTLRLDPLFSGLRDRHAGVVIQLNHPRGPMGALTQLEVDTATGATHADPARFRMEPSASASPDDTGLFSLAFDAIEVQTGLNASTAALNDWMTFLSRGFVKTATAVSDSHQALSAPPGYARTFVEVGTDAPSALAPQAFAAALRAGKAIGTNGPFLQVRAVRLDASGQPAGAAVGRGETLSVASGEKVELTVDVQAPEWMTFDAIELFTHAEGRSAEGGVANETWPESRVHASRRLDPAALPLEAVPGTNGLTFRRIHVVERFTVTPAADSWYVVVVRGGSAARSLFPLAWNGLSCDSGRCEAQAARPYAFSNAILVDADGSGAYDDFPATLGQGLRAPPAPAPARRVPTEEELADALRELLESHGGHR